MYYDVNIPYYEGMENAEHFTYNRAWDGHGGHREEHRREMQEIAEMVADQKIAAMVPQIQATALQQARDDLLRAITFDVETVVQVALHNGETIFKDKRTQKVIADNIMREIRKRLDRFTI